MFNINDKHIRVYTVIYLVHKGRVLLLKKQPNAPLLAGKWIGLGGKVEPGENLYDSAQREFQEETGLTIDHLLVQGTFTWFQQPNFGGISYLLTANHFQGTLLHATREGELSWHDIATIERLDNIASYQLDYLLSMLRDPNYFYTGVAFFDADDHRLGYADSAKHFEERKNAASCTRGAQEKRIDLFTSH